MKVLRAMALTLAMISMFAGAQVGSAQTPNVAAPGAQLLAAAEALAAGDHKGALEQVNGALAKTPDDLSALVLRAKIRTARQEYAEALADLERAVAAAPDQPALYDLRGDARFRVGDFSGALADFDEYLDRRPQARPGHWRRGIVCYYAGKFAAGRDQFAAYQTVDDADVENAVWHYLCNARVVGREQARTEIPKVRPDRRVPLMTVLELFQGKATVDDVDRACDGPDLTPEEKASRRFFANLYAGLFLVSEEQPAAALERLAAAADPALADPKHGGGGYMWEVARVHAAELRKAQEKAK
ncbi:MAG: tetratricopeptide repeat protein [Pirellulales bacterium]